MKYIYFRYVLIILFLPKIIFGSLIFNCTFPQDDFPEGATNEASCSMFPNDVYVGRGNPDVYEKWQHCKEEQVFAQELLNDVTINLIEKTVSWTKIYKQTEFSQKSMYNYYLEEGYTEEEAFESSNTSYERDENFNIRYVYEYEDGLYWNSKFNKPYEPEKIVKLKQIKFGGSVYEFDLFIPLIDHAQSILTQYNFNDSNSWVSHRFGYCIPS